MRMADNALNKLNFALEKLMPMSIENKENGKRFDANRRQEFDSCAAPSVVVFPAVSSSFPFVRARIGQGWSGVCTTGVQNTV